MGLPMVLVPMYGDQFHNSAAAKTRGAAMVVDFSNLNEQSLRHALDEVFNNTRYASSLRFNPKVRNLFSFYFFERKSLCKGRFMMLKSVLRSGFFIDDEMENKITWFKLNSQ